MTYRYEPGSDDSSKLAESLKSELPEVNFKFQLEQDTGILRIRGDVGGYNDFRSYEQRLTNEWCPEKTVEVFRKHLQL